MKSRLNLYNKNGDQLNLAALGLFGNKLQIPSPSFNTQTTQIDNGLSIVIDKQLISRELSAQFVTFANSYQEQLKQRFDLFALIGNGEEFYIEQDLYPGILWKCHLGSWTPELIGTQTTTLDIPLTCMSGVSETINLTNSKFTTSLFTFVNEGNLLIDPRLHSETELTFKGESTNLSIANNSTGETWSYTGNTLVDDEVVLKGIRSLKNNVSIFKDTNKKIITFVPGKNEFQIDGVSGAFELTIRTRFYFL